jgi:hypothetical protein
MSVLRAKREGLRSCSAAVSYRILCAIVGDSRGGGRQRPTSIQNVWSRSLISLHFLVQAAAAWPVAARAQ